MRVSNTGSACHAAPDPGGGKVDLFVMLPGDVRGELACSHAARKLATAGLLSRS